MRYVPCYHESMEAVDEQMTGKISRPDLAIVSVLTFALSFALVPFITFRQGISHLSLFDFRNPSYYSDPSLLGIFLNGFCATALVGLILSVPVIIGLAVFIKRSLWQKLLGVVILPIALFGMYMIFEQRFDILARGGIGGISLSYGDMIPRAFFSFPLAAFAIFFVVFAISRMRIKLSVALIIFLLLFMSSVYKIYADSSILKTENQQAWTENRDQHFQAVASYVWNQRFGYSRSTIKKTSIEFKKWPDSCLGLPMVGEACEATVTPGVAVTIEDVSGKVYVYHIDQNASGLDASRVRLAQ